MSHRWATGCAGLAAVLAALVVAAVVWLGHTTAKLSAPPPGPAAYARSAGVRGDDAAAGAWQDQFFASLRARAPWLAPAGRSVLDVCSAGGGGGGLFDGGSEVIYTCDRYDTRYYAYGGDDAARLRSLRQVLSRLGWGGFTTAVPSAGAPLPVVSADPTALLAVPVGKAGLQYSWSGRGGRLNLRQDLGAVPARTAPDRDTYLQVVRPDQSQILASLTASRPYVLIVSIDAAYARGYGSAAGTDP